MIFTFYNVYEEMYLGQTPSLSPASRGLWTPTGVQEPLQAEQPQLPQPFPRQSPVPGPLCGSTASPEEAAVPPFLPLAAFPHPFPLLKGFK